jgi:hypothetical protein
MARHSWTVVAVRDTRFKGGGEKIPGFEGSQAVPSGTSSRGRVKR